MGFFDVIFEGDTAQVISDINSSPLYISRIGHFYDSIHVEKQFLRLCSFIFILREANFAVYSLTKEAACHKTNLCWQEDIPNNITSIIPWGSWYSPDPVCGIKLFSWFLV
jgi:hypothetical protein